MPEVAVQRYYEIRQEYWRLRELSWADLDEYKRRTHDFAILRAKLSSCVTDLLRLGHAGHVEACFILGEAYAAGNGVSLDRAKAIAWFRKHACMGSVFTFQPQREGIPGRPQSAVSGQAGLFADVSRLGQGGSRKRVSPYFSTERLPPYYKARSKD